MDGVPTQTEGTSEILASDWNTYVRDNFDSIKFGHIVCTSSTRPTGIQEGTMVYETDTNLIYIHNGSSFTQNNLSPVGMISPFAGSSAPDGWLLCHGQAVSQVTYATLFALIGSTYDVTGPGAGNFRVPDLRGRTIFGQGTNADVDALGDNEGIDAANVINRRPKHKHTAASTTSVANVNPSGPWNHSHGANVTLPFDTRQNGGGISYNNLAPRAVTAPTAVFGVGVDNTDLNHAHTATTSTTVGPQTTDSPTDVIPYLTLNYIIKA
jgi:microcystin-dependent protein